MRRSGKGARVRRSGDQEIGEGSKGEEIRKIRVEQQGQGGCVCEGGCCEGKEAKKPRGGPGAAPGPPRAAQGGDPAQKMKDSSH